MSINKLIIVILTIFSINSFSQEQEQNDTIHYKGKIDIVLIYEKVLEDGYESEQIYQMLATTNYHRGKYTESKKWLEILFKKYPKTEEEFYIIFNKTLKEIEKLEK